MLDFWSRIPWLRPRSGLQEEASPGLPVGRAVGPDILPDALASASGENIAPVFDEVTLPAAGNPSPFQFTNDQRLLPRRFAGDRGLLLPPSAPLLLPSQAGSGLLGLEPLALGGELQPDAYAPLLRTDAVDPLSSRVVTMPLSGVPDAPLPGSTARAGFLSADDPIYVAQLPQERVQGTSGAIPSEGGRENRPADAFARFDFGPALTPVGAGHDSLPGISPTFDPQFIVPTQVGRPPPPTPPRQPTPPGPGHNSGQARPPATPPPLPPQSAPGSPSPRPSTAVEPPPNTAGPAAAAAQPTVEPRPPHPLPKAAEAWQGIAKAIYEDAPGGQYEELDAKKTAIGIQLNPRLPEPAAGYEYVPVHPHLQRAFTGELQLGNRIVGAMKGEIVVHFGMPAGRHGPDVISLGTEGEVSFWDSKFRSSPRSVGSGMAAHHSRASLNAALAVAEKEIKKAIADGRIPPAIADKALENVRNGNVFINTVGTGIAHGAVVRCVRNKEFVDCWSK